MFVLFECNCYFLVEFFRGVVHSVTMVPAVSETQHSTCEVFEICPNLVFPGNEKALNHLDQSQPSHLLRCTLDSLMQPNSTTSCANRSTTRTLYFQIHDSHHVFLLQQWFSSVLHMNKARTLSRNALHVTASTTKGSKNLRHNHEPCSSLHPHASHLEPENRPSIDPQVTPVVRHVHDLPPRRSERQLNLINSTNSTFYSHHSRLSTWVLKRSEINSP